MRVKRLWIYLALAAVTLTAAACGLLQEATPAPPIEAVPLETETAAEQETGAPQVESAEASEEPETGDEVSAEVEQSAETGEPATTGRIVYAISQEESQVRFELDEDLRGQRQTVVGVTNQVAGQVALNPAEPGEAEIGEIRISAAALETDSSLRNRAIRNFILETNQHEFITFTPTAISGLPAEVTSGQQVEFTVTGDLTIRTITQPVTFAVSASADPGRLVRGTATATIDRTDFGLTIPSVPNVANVEEEVELIINFVAYATS